VEGRQCHQVQIKNELTVDTVKLKPYRGVLQVDAWIAPLGGTVRTE
jgi:hypothetical protein